MADEGPRTRTRDTTSKSTPITIYGKTYNGTASDPYRFNPIQATGLCWSPEGNEVMHDVVTKNYRSRSAAGEVICNPSDRIVKNYSYSAASLYSRSLVKEVDVGGVKTWQGDWWNGLWPLTRDEFGSLLDTAMYPEITQELASLQDQAVSKAHANASQAEVSALMILGEGRKTVESIVSILRRAFKILIAVKNLDVKFLAKQISPDELADRYMEARYALRPLMYDVEGVLKAWQTTIPNLKRRSTSRGFETQRWERKTTVTFDHSASLTTRTFEKKFVAEATVRAGLLCDVDVSHISVWGVDTVFETALELIPFSFIANWFFNIADTLASWTPKAGVRKLASWVTISSLVVSSSELVHIANTSPAGLLYPEMTWGGKYTGTISRKQRIVNPSRSILPHWNVQLDTLKLIDLTKIFSQLR